MCSRTYTNWPRSIDLTSTCRPQSALAPLSSPSRNPVNLVSSRQPETRAFHAIAAIAKLISAAFPARSCKLNEIVMGCQSGCDLNVGLGGEKEKDNFASWCSGVHCDMIPSLSDCFVEEVIKYDCTQWKGNVADAHTIWYNSGEGKGGHDNLSSFEC